MTMNYIIGPSILCNVKNKRKGIARVKCPASKSLKWTFYNFRNESFPCCYLSTHLFGMQIPKATTNEASFILLEKSKFFKTNKYFYTEVTMSMLGQ